MRVWLAWFTALGIAASAGSDVWASINGPSLRCTLETRWEHQPPYWLARPGKPPTGYLAQTLGEAARRIGCEMRFNEMSWARGLTELEAGRIDVIAGAVRSPERERFARFTRPINMARNMLFLRADRASSAALSTLAELADTDLRIGVEAGAVYSPEYRRLLDDPRFASRLRPIIGPQSGWRMLAGNRLDGLLTDEVSAITQSAGSGASTPLKGVLVVSVSTSHVMVGRHLDPATAQALDAALEVMVAEGWLPQLREAWIPCPVDPATMGCRTGERIEATVASERASGARDAASLSPPSR